MSATELLTGVQIAFVLLGVLLVLLWILMPLAVFAIRTLLRELLDELRAAHATLRALRDREPPPR